MHTFVSSFLATAPFVLRYGMPFLKLVLIFLYLLHSTHSFVQNGVRSSDNRIAVSLSPNDGDDRAVSILLESKHQSDDWHRYCENVDKNMEGLVSPSPESFNAIHLALVRVNAAASININDIVALSRYLSKPNYTMTLFHDDGIVKWRMVENEGGSSEGVVVDSNITLEKGGRQLYHGFSTLQLSQMALELATNENNHDANLLSKIHEVAYQAEVSCLPLASPSNFQFGPFLFFSMLRLQYFNI